jgi:hypothetical protein
LHARILADLRVMALQQALSARVKALQAGAAASSEPFITES